MVVDAAQWDLYADALIECEIDGRAHPLRAPDAGPLPGAAPLFVLTAYNPEGRTRARERNEAAEARLEAELTRTGSVFWPATGRSRDATWSEPGVAVPAWTGSVPAGSGVASASWRCSS